MRCYLCMITKTIDDFDIPRRGSHFSIPNHACRDCMNPTPDVTNIIPSISLLPSPVVQSRYNKLIEEAQDKTVAPAPVDETSAPAPVDETAAPAPVDETVAPAPVDETAAPAPVDETAAPAPVDETVAPALKTKTKSKTSMD